MSGQDIIIQQLRDDVHRLEAERDDYKKSAMHYLSASVDAWRERDEALLRRTRAERVGEVILQWVGEDTISDLRHRARNANGDFAWLLTEIANAL